VKKGKKNNLHITGTPKVQRGTECRTIHALTTQIKSLIPRQKRASEIVNVEVLEGKHVQR